MPPHPQLYEIDIDACITRLSFPKVRREKRRLSPAFWLPFCQRLMLFLAVLQFAEHVKSRYSEKVRANPYISSPPLLKRTVPPLSLHHHRTITAAVNRISGGVD